MARPQYVRLNDTLSDVVWTRTGAPQGTVLAPFLFTLFTADFRHSDFSCHMQKFSDDTVLVGLITKGDSQAYCRDIDSFSQWCDQNFLELNVSKTKEMIINFSRDRKSVPPVSLKGKDIEVVQEYKYLGVVLDSKLNWHKNCDLVFKKAQSRLFHLRKLRSFGVGRSLLLTFHHGILASILFYGVIAWGGSITASDRNRLNKVLKKAGSVIGVPVDSLETVLAKRLNKKLRVIFCVEQHPFADIFESMRSPFSGRLRMPVCSTERFRKSFVPAAVRFYNDCF